MKRFIISTAAVLLCTLAFAQTRTVRSINDSWNFTKEGVTTLVNIPHSWNAHDTWDEEPGFYRGLCTYERKVRINDDLEGKRIYARFEGAYQVCELIVNGKSVGTHKGGYTAFIFDITDAVMQGENNFLVKLDSSHNPDIPPLSADFTFYGGIYRDVDIVITPEDHICNTHYASNGVYITTPVVGETSTVNVKTMLSVTTPAKYVLRQQVFAPDGQLAATAEKKLNFKKLPAPEAQVFDQAISLSDCKLWDIENPVLYRVVTELCDAKGNLIDRVENPLGLRTFKFDVENGFSLNGRSLKIMGTNRHQDYEDRGNALADEMHVRDIKLLKDMGGNFLRISHYPQDPIVTQMCDHNGIVCSVEIPVVNYTTMTPEFTQNCVEMAREMVCQDYNSPSVLIWAYMNEVLLRNVPGNKDKNKKAAYYKYTAECAAAIDAAIKELDPYRPTMIPCHSDYKRYKESGVGEVPDILGWNFYRGWYGKVFEDFTKEIAEIHTTFPDKPFILTEYGAGVDPRLHSRAPERFDFSMEHGLAFHKYYIREIKSTPYISGSNVWNLNDFYAEPRVDAVPHVNNKGLVSLSRVPKDTYLLYQAHLLSKPFLAIGGREWKLRGGNEGETQTVDVYTNRKGVTLFLNGKKVGTADAIDKVASFKITLQNGENIIAAESDCGLKDAIRVQYAAVPRDLSKFTEMNVSLGSNCWFEDDIQGASWIPEQEYTPGSWGYVGGEMMRIKTGNGLLPGTNADIMGTINNPIFQTQRKNIESFKADVPDGKYYVYLYFAELAVNSSGKPQPYNLGNDVIAIAETERVFNVTINGTPVLNNYNIRQEEGPCQAAIRKFTVDVVGGQGLSVDFGKVKGEPVLNAIRVYRAL